jgi:hypothetical protein
MQINIKKGRIKKLNDQEYITIDDQCIKIGICNITDFVEHGKQQCKNK